MRETAAPMLAEVYLEFTRKVFEVESKSAACFGLNMFHVMGHARCDARSSMPRSFSAVLTVQR
jgi:hypothetical protein